VDRGIASYFEGKPLSYEHFKAIYQKVRSLGNFDVTVKSQISFSVNRKFAWFWLYNVTKANPNGVLHVMLCLDRPVEDRHVRDISQISRNRWNHQIVIRTLRDANSEWLRKLLEAAYSFGSA
jgi:hypothetical protein